MEDLIELKIKIRKNLRKRLDPFRYEHSLGVSYTSACLAMKYGCDLEKAELAGLIHDCGKRYPDNIIIKKCMKHGIPLSKEELAAPAVLHAKYGAWLAEHKYGITDNEILQAVCFHTTGKPDMTLLEKIIYVADYIEPRRNKAPDLAKMRKLAFEDLDRTVYEMLCSTLKYLERKGSPVDPMTRKAYDYYKTQQAEKKGNKA